jgi:GTP-binding protein YchF
MSGRKISASVEFVDIAGLVKGASKGEGLGNQFLSHIRETGIIAHVVRCFEDSDIIHVNNKVDPVSDIETINIELALADLQTLEKRHERAEKMLKDQAEKKNTLAVLAALEKIKTSLNNGKPVRHVNLSDEEKSLVFDCRFITLKPQLYVCNVDEETIRNLAAGKDEGCHHVQAVRKITESEGSAAISICGKFEAELSDITEQEEKQAFLEELGLKETGLSTLIRSAYQLLNLRTFFSRNEEECRAWTIKAGDTTPKAAGVIHTDFEKGFVKAEVYSCDEIFKYGTEAKIREAGKYRIEGKDYIVQDGDVIFFRFNV